jgi:hypothetical protein
MSRRQDLGEILRRQVEEEMRNEMYDSDSDSDSDTEIESSIRERPLRRSAPIENLIEIDEDLPEAYEPVENFEEDHGYYDSIEIDEKSSKLEDTYVKENEIDETCKPEDPNKINYKRKMMMKNCISCYDLYTMENLSDKDNIISIKKYDHIKQKLDKGICIDVDQIKQMIKSNIGEAVPPNFFSIYTKRPGAKDTMGGHGTYPINKIVIKIDVQGPMYITLGSLYTLLKASDAMIDEFYAVPLFGGKRRRIGNLEGAFYQSSHHGQIPGFIIYKIYTKRELKEGVIADIKKDDFVFPIYIARAMNEMLTLFQDTPQIRIEVINSIIEYLLQSADDEQQIYY